MKKGLILILMAALMVACGGEEKAENNAQQELLDKIEMLHNRVDEAGDEALVSDQHELMLSYQEFGNTYGDHPQAAEYYFKAAEIAYGMRKFEHAVTLFTKVFEGYPEFDKRATSLFFIAFIHENFLHQNKQAIAYYEQVIEEFPESQEAKDAMAIIPLIGLSEEELIKLFEEKNKTADAE